MILLFTGALVVAGLFTLLPGRIMHASCSAVSAAAGDGAGRAVSQPRQRPFAARSAGPVRSPRRRGPARKSLEKRRENPLAGIALRVVWRRSMRYMIRIKN